MANSPQAIKRARQNSQRALRNQGQRAAMRTAVKNLLKAVTQGQKEVATEAFKLASSKLDRVAGRGLIPLSRAARYKKRLHAKLKAMA